MALTHGSPPTPGPGMQALTSPRPSRPLAVVTGASTGIGRELAIECARSGFDLVIAADQGPLEETADTLRKLGAGVDALVLDLASASGVSALVAQIGERPVAALLANAGHGLGRAFLDQDFADIRHVINTNVTGTLDLLYQMGRRMRLQGRGRILVTGSIAGRMPGSFQAVYNSTKAFIDSFCHALRDELKESGITVTCLIPGPTDTDFFERADMLDTGVATGKKANPADVARAGFEAMMSGESGVVAGWKNKLQALMANVTPDTLLAQQHRRMAKPGSARP